MQLTLDVRFLRLALVLGLVAQIGLPIERVFGSDDSPSATMSIDLTDAPRHKARNEMVWHLPSRGSAHHGSEGQVDAVRKIIFWYPKWIPGIHAPRGPVENLGGLVFRDAGGNRLPWNRDIGDPYRFVVEVPLDVDRVHVQLDYICNQPSSNSEGVDLMADSKLAVVNWNTLLVYPDGPTCDQITVKAEVKLPGDWKFATSLPVAQSEAGHIEFDPVTLRRFVDGPLLAGTHMRSHILSEIGEPAVRMHFVSEDERAIELPEELIDQYRQLVREARQLFKTLPFETYDFLCVCSHKIEVGGLEHRSSSLNGFDTLELTSEQMRIGYAAELIPHEFAHAWIGKACRPAGMVTGNYHSDKDLRMLWVYEGLTEYLGQVLTVRSGLHSEQVFRDKLAHTIDTYLHRPGRRWRSLEDTCVSSYLLRDTSRYWDSMRRGQDYYDEGSLLWMEADAIIRVKSEGQFSLDDFCRRLVETVEADSPIKPFTHADMYSILADLADHPWEEHFRERVQEPREQLDIEWVAQLGYRYDYRAWPNRYSRAMSDQYGEVAHLASVGLIMSESTIESVIPGSAADRAKLAEGQDVLKVNGEPYSQLRMNAALRASHSTGTLELVVAGDGEAMTAILECEEGLRFPCLKRTTDRENLLRQIAMPQAAVESSSGVPE